MARYIDAQTIEVNLLDCLKKQALISLKTMWAIMLPSQRNIKLGENRP